MSALLRSAKNAEISADAQRRVIIRSRNNSYPQWSQPVSASTRSIKAGDTVNVDLKFNSDRVEIEKRHFLKYNIKNAHATDTINFPQSSLAHWQQVNFIINNGEKKIEVKGVHTIREIVGDYWMNLGVNIYEESSFVRDGEFETYAGVAVGPVGTKEFYFPLDPLISFAGTCVKGEILDMRLELTALSEQSNTAEAGRYCKSSSTTNLWTVANITIDNLCHIREYTEIRDPNLLVYFMKSLDPKIPIRLVNWVVDRKVVYTGAWNVGSSWNGKLSEITKMGKIQHLSVVAEPVIAATNSAECCKEYSGHHFIGYKHVELNRGNDGKTIDMTDLRKLRDFEIKQEKNEYGQKKLPKELYTDSTNLMNKYFLRQTRITFDDIKVEDTHEVVRFTDPNVQDYELTIQANGNAGSNCNLVIYVVRAEEYEFDRATGRPKLIGA
jgi:hypothetical protein